MLRPLASIKWKLTLVFAVLAALTSLTVGTLSYSFLRERVENQTRVYLQNAAGAIADHLAPSLQPEKQKPIWRQAGRPS